ncbi:ABC transporter substrate-binding protein [Anaerolentibacter hominis]|uniref:ABC transporter substrate-binding protein n=1 Tax=Anaerolentibacter hominis TaxID=3079009 RepID=UPI0031B8B026
MKCNSRKLPVILCLLLGMILLGGCSPKEESTGAAAYTFTDSLGNEVVIKETPERTVALMGSFAETWLLSGGTLAAVTDDAYSERNLDLPEDTVRLGRFQEPDLEAVLGLNPDFVLLSADTEGHVKLAGTLKSAGIPAAYFRVDTFDDYLAMLKICTDITGREDLYKENGTKIQAEIDEVISSVQGKEAPRVLYMRAYSTGVKAKGEDSLTGAMLDDLGAVNIVNENGASLLENLQMESIIAADPDFILVTTMGSDTEKALEMVRTTMEENPAWGSLTAVKEGHYLVLPKELFHYKPNARWGESYEMLAEILYGKEPDTKP